MEKHDKTPPQLESLSLSDLHEVQGGSGSNTVFVRRNGETGILVSAAEEVAGGMSGGTGVGG